MSALNPDHETQLAALVHLRLRKGRAEADHGTLRNIQRDLDHIAQEAAETRAQFLAAELAAFVTPDDLHYDGLQLVSQRWVHTWTDMDANTPAHGGSFALSSLDVTAAEICRARDEQRARFAVGSLRDSIGSATASAAVPETKVYVAPTLRVLPDGCGAEIWFDQDLQGSYPTTDMALDAYSVLTGIPRKMLSVPAAIAPAMEAAR